jgi:hypothetical protein
MTDLETAEELATLLEQWKNRPDESVQPPATPAAVTPVPIPQRKRCPSCDRRKPSAAFHRNRSRKDGLATYCRPCEKRRSARRYRERTGKTPRAPRTNMAGWTVEQRKEHKRSMDAARRLAKRAEQQAVQQLNLADELAQFKAARERELQLAIKRLSAESGMAVNINALSTKEGNI